VASWERNKSGIPTASMTAPDRRSERCVLNKLEDASASVLGHDQPIERRARLLGQRPAIEKHLRAAHNHLVDVDNIVSRIWGHGSREQKAIRAALTKIQKL
jgi:hypothetical protein